MKILSLDEVHQEWKKQLNQTGLLRYGLFFEEMHRVSVVVAKSVRGVVDILESKRGVDFPYKELKIGVLTESHWKKINKPTHMGVLIEYNSKLYLLEGTIDNPLMLTKWSNTDLKNITL